MLNVDVYIKGEACDDAVRSLRWLVKRGVFLGLVNLILIMLLFIDDNSLRLQ